MIDLTIFGYVSCTFLLLGIVGYGLAVRFGAGKDEKEAIITLTLALTVLWWMVAFAAAALLFGWVVWQGFCLPFKGSAWVFSRGRK